MELLVTSRQYIRIPVDPPDDAEDPTAAVPEAALIADDGTEPADGDYHDAEWIGGKVALLVGPGTAVQYPAGEYMAFARLTAGVERPVIKSGRVRVGLAAVP